MTIASGTDLDCRQNISAFVDCFYQKLLTDPQLSPLFLEVAGIDVAVHLPHIKDYWCKLLLGDKGYKRHTMNIHRHLNQKQTLLSQDFRRWLALFEMTLDEGFSGPKAEQARKTARSIAKNMEVALDPARDL